MGNGLPGTVRHGSGRYEPVQLARERPERRPPDQQQGLPPGPGQRARPVRRAGPRSGAPGRSVPPAAGAGPTDGAAGAGSGRGVGGVGGMAEGEARLAPTTGEAVCSQETPRFPTD